MTEKQLQYKEKPACSYKNLPVPVIIKCSGCGEDFEFWTDETEAVCPTCGQTAKMENNSIS